MVSAFLLTIQIIRISFQFLINLNDSSEVSNRGISGLLQRILTLLGRNTTKKDWLMMSLELYDLYRQNITNTILHCYYHQQNSYDSLKKRLLETPRKCLQDSLRPIQENTKGVVVDVQKASSTLVNFIKTFEDFEKTFALLRLTADEIDYYLDVVSRLHVIVDNINILLDVPTCISIEIMNITLNVEAELRKTMFCIQLEVKEKGNCDEA